MSLLNKANYYRNSLEIMRTQEPKLREIYLQQIIEVTNRLNTTKLFFDSYSKSGNEIDFDSGVLQLRKALEATAYASIAPNKAKYQFFRQKSHTSQDFTKDFNASKIFKDLREINKDFYPVPLLPAKRQDDNSLHYDRKEQGFLSEKKFQKTYDRLGKFLHADNPWGTNKQRQNIAKDIDERIKETRELLELHATFIRTNNYKGVWVVEVPRSGSAPKIISASADGDFVVNDT
jgi:hypothetical protein